MKDMPLLLRIMALSWLLCSQLTFANTEAIFAKTKPTLLQVKVIDIQSGEKSSIGTGFLIADGNLAATNYHVVSSYVQYPLQYRLQYQQEWVDDQGQSQLLQGELTLQAIDVVNDLAVVALPAAQRQALALATTAPTRGSTLYSLGNPHDLGMIVVPGTYNGLKEASFYDRIHFTGAINPGMSGGPTINEQGQVVGINVATAGNQIGFLVPVDKLQALLASEQVTSDQHQWFSEIKQQLWRNQQRLQQQLLSKDWPLEALGDVRVPTEIQPYLRCWGDSNQNEPKRIHQSVMRVCRFSDDIYLHQQFNTGSVELEYEWLSAENLHEQHFYNLIEQRIRTARGPNRVNQDDVSEYQCQVDTLAAPLKQRVVFCSRKYLKYSGLFDALYLAVTLNGADRALISHFTLSGVSQAFALDFSKRFVGAVQWQ